MEQHGWGKIAEWWSQSNERMTRQSAEELAQVERSAQGSVSRTMAMAEGAPEPSNAIARVALRGGAGPMKGALEVLRGLTRTGVKPEARTLEKAAKWFGTPEGKEIVEWVAGLEYENRETAPYRAGAWARKGEVAAVVQRLEPMLKSTARTAGEDLERAIRYVSGHTRNASERAEIAHEIIEQVKTRGMKDRNLGAVASGLLIDDPGSAWKAVKEISDPEKRFKHARQWVSEAKAEARLTETAIGEILEMMADESTAAKTTGQDLYLLMEAARRSGTGAKIAAKLGEIRGANGKRPYLSIANRTMTRMEVNEEAREVLVELVEKAAAQQPPESNRMKNLAEVLERWIWKEGGDARDRRMGQAAKTIATQESGTGSEVESEIYGCLAEMADNEDWEEHAIRAIHAGAMQFERTGGSEGISGRGFGWKRMQRPAPSRWATVWRNIEDRYPAKTRRYVNNALRARNAEEEARMHALDEIAAIVAAPATATRLEALAKAWRRCEGASTAGDG